MPIAIAWADDIDCMLHEMHQWQQGAPAWHNSFYFAPLGLLAHCLHTGSTSAVLDDTAPLLLDKRQHDAPQFLPMLAFAGQRCGYWLDEDARSPSFVVVAVAGRYQLLGRNLFDALRTLLETTVQREQLTDAVAASIRSWIAHYATAQWPETGAEYLSIYPVKAQRARTALAAAHTQDGMGIWLRPGEAERMDALTLRRWQQAQDALCLHTNAPKPALQQLGQVFEQTSRPILAAITTGQQILLA